VAWLPLVILSLIQGDAYGRVAGTTVLSDWAVTARLLVGVPLLIAIQTETDRQMMRIAQTLRSTGLVLPGEVARLAHIISSTTQLAHSTAGEIIFAVLALAQSAFLLNLAVSRGDLLWVHHAGGFLGLSLPGWWCVVIALPLSTLVAMRWAWRVILWWRFCWLVSRLELQIVPSHPDRAGGLGFLNIPLPIFGMAAAGALCGMAGTFATRILATGAKLGDLQGPAITCLVGTLIVFAGPLTLFVVRLWRAKNQGIVAYGALVCAQARAFDDRWIAPGAVVDGGALKDEDFTARTDLNTVVEVVYGMRTTVYTIRHLIGLVVVAALPFGPVALLLVPVKQIVHGLLGLFM
jgi:hypothetical protein